jgi:tetratricopeptide (TPR) repeat protein
MKHGTYSALGASMLVAAVAGCQAPAPSDMTMQRGSQLLAAGSPKAAIPFLAQTIASRPDGPEPIALLALAYALDRQADRAILQAQQVHRPAGAPPGWETVAVGIAAMVQRRPADAQKSLERVLDTAGADSSLGQATMQWLALAQLLNGDRDQALETVQALAESPAMKPTAMLWAALIHAQGGRSQQASAALVQCAAAIVSRREPTLEGETGGQSTYDSAVAAVAAGEMGPAQERFLSLQQDALGPADTAVWLAMISGSYGDWPESRTMLKEACRSSSPPARGLANQLFGVVCALEDRPDSMIEHILAGQRALGRHQTPLYITEPPKPESVWFSDFMK